MLLRLLIFVPFFFTFSISIGSATRDTIKYVQTHNLKGQFLKIGSGAGWFAIRDVETSPLIYKGVLPSIQIGACLYGKKMVTLFDFNFSYGHLTTRNYPFYEENSATAYNNFLSLSIARKIELGSMSKTNLFVGGNLALTANFRDNSKFNNANFNWEAFSTFGPTVIIEKELDLSSDNVNLGLFRWPFRDRIIKLSASFSLPVLSEIGRPPYTTIGDFVDGHSSYFSLKDMQLVSFHNFFNLVSTTNVTYYLQNGNRFNLSYYWYYYDYNPSINKVKGIAGIFSFSFLFRLNKINNR